MAIPFTASSATRELWAAGFTQRDVAHKLGVTPRAVGFWLDGTNAPPASFVDLLVDLIGREATDRILAAIPSKTEAAPLADAA